MWKPRAPLIVRPTQAEEAARIEHLLDGSVFHEEFAAILARWRAASGSNRAAVAGVRRKQAGTRPRSRRP